MFKIRGHKTGRQLHLKEATRRLLCTIRSESGVACRIFSDHISNISDRNTRKSAKALDVVIRKDAGGSIINRTDEEAIELVKKFIRGEYEKQKLDRTKPLAIIMSIYAAVVEFGIDVHQGIQKLVGGSYPNHAFPLPESGKVMLDLVD